MLKWVRQTEEDCKMPNTQNLNMLSLFSGCGGMDLGFEGGFRVLSRSVNTNIHADWVADEQKGQILLAKTVFTTVFANDIMTDAKTAWETYFLSRKDISNVYHLDSVVDLVKRAQTGESVFPSHIDVVCGGFPCQDFSISGLRKGFNSHKSHNGGYLDADESTAENRGHLYMWMRDVITLTKPKIFIAENVKGLTNLDDVKDVIEHDFAQACDGGYLVVPAKVIHAANYGVPQNRERVIFFGFRKSALKKAALDELSQCNINSKYDPYPLPTHSYTEYGDDLQPFVSCSEALHGLKEPDKTTDLSQKAFSCAKYMGKHCQGQSEINLDGVGPTIRSEHHGNIEYRRLSKEHGGTHTKELRAGLPERRLTIRECARIQTFPDDYEFVIPGKLSASSAYKIIGNAVPPVLAYNIARRLQDNWSLYFKEE